MCRIILVFLMLVFSYTTWAQVLFNEKDFVFVKGGYDTIPVISFEETTTADFEEEVYVNEIKDFYIGTTCVSVQDYKTFCAATGKTMPKAPQWGWEDVKKPMVNISYIEALAYCKWLTNKYQVKIRLPENEEWTYAANNGDFADQATYDYVPENIKKYAVYKENSANKPNCITCKQPNALGVYDMNGNVWEWVEGWFYTLGDTLDVSIEEQSMIMGGSFLSAKEDMHVQSARMIKRTAKAKDVGFRLAISAVDYKNAQILSKLNTYLTTAYGDAPPVKFTLEGIEADGKLILWNDFISFRVDEDNVNFTINGQLVTDYGKTPYPVQNQYKQEQKETILNLQVDFLAVYERFQHNEEEI